MPSDGEIMQDRMSLVRLVLHLQDYPLDAERARQLGVELDTFGDLLKRELPGLDYDHQPADFRAVQQGAKPHG